MTYLTRAAKYFLSICVLSAVLIAGLYAFGMAAGTPSDLLYILFRTYNGWIFIGAVVLLSLLYPRMGFMTAQVAGDTKLHREKIVETLCKEGFVQAEESGECLIFRAGSLGRRLRLRFDDRVVVRQSGSWILLEGSRKVISRIQYRLESNIRKNE